MSALAYSSGVDYLVCQGVEPGGHLQGLRPLDRVLSDVLEEVRHRGADVAVLASGGLATGGDVRRVIASGASGAVLGTRFVATVESAAHPEYKRALLRATGPSDTVATTCLSKGRPSAPHRIILFNNIFHMWDAAGCPPEGQRPGERDVIGFGGDGSAVERYRFTIPVESTSGDVLAMGTFAGSGVGAVRDVPAAGVLVQRLWDEYEQAGE